MNSKYPIVGLYDHNADAYDAVKAALIEDDVAAIVHATGTGKSYIALQLAYDNPDKKILYVVPSTGIIEHIKEIINSNPYMYMSNNSAEITLLYSNLFDNLTAILFNIIEFTFHL